jgi:hypothetical protein
VVYITFADFPEALGNNGWIFGYQLSGNSFSQTAIASSTAFGSGGGFWGSGAAPASDNTNIYTTTGNGTFDVNSGGTDYGDSLLKLGPSSFWPPADWYTPGDVFSYQGKNSQGQPCTTRCLCDEDLSSGGVLVVPPAYTYTCTGSNCTQCTAGTGGSCKVVINGDKESKIYVANQASLGHFNSTDQNIEVVQTPYPVLDIEQGYWASPAYWNDGTKNWIFYSATDSVTGDAPFPIDGYELSPSGAAGSYNPVPQTPSATTVSSTGSAIGFCQYSPTPSVSSNGTSASSGIVWAIERPNGDNPFPGDCKGSVSAHAVLHAFCATNAGGRCTTALTELYNSAQNVQKHYISGDVSFSTPTIFNGLVYMGTKTPSGATTSELDVFGLCSNNGPSGCLD